MELTEHRTSLKGPGAVPSQFVRGWKLEALILVATLELAARRNGGGRSSVTEQPARRWRSSAQHECGHDATRNEYTVSHNHRQSATAAKACAG